MCLFKKLLPWWTHFQAWWTLNVKPAIVPCLWGQLLQPRAALLSLSTHFIILLLLTDPSSLRGSFLFCIAPSLSVSNFSPFSRLCWPSPYHLLSLTPSHPGTHLFWLGILIPVLLPSIALTLIASTNCGYFSSLKVMRPSVLQMLGIIQWSL